MPEPRRPAPLHPRSSVIYFDIVQDTESMEEHASDPSSDDHELAKGLLADVHRLLDLETRAIADVEKLLGVRVHAEGHDENDLICKVYVDTWDEVRQISEKVQGAHGGGDDIVYLNTPYSEARQFVLYPGGVNGRRFGPSEDDGTLEEWVEWNKPLHLRSALERQETADPREHHLVCTWDDGWELWRMTPSRDLVTHKSPAGYAEEDRVILELIEGNRVAARLVLWDFTDRKGLPVSRNLVYDTEVVSDEQISNVLSRLSWFIWASTPSSFFELEVSQALVSDLRLPRDLPDRVSALTASHPIEKRALSEHRNVVGPQDDSKLPYLDVMNLDDLETLLDGVARKEETDRISFQFSTSGTEGYWIYHGKLSATIEEDLSAWPRGPSTIEYSPSWTVHTRSVMPDTPASWYIVNLFDEVVGAGLTPAGALRDVPYFVWPGEKQEWMERNFKSGTLSSNADIYRLLGEWTPAFWTDEKFLELVGAGSDS